jgi:hypothetical protein
VALRSAGECVQTLAESLESCCASCFLSYLSEFMRITKEIE